jgi:hypothetical protein
MINIFLSRPTTLPSQFEKAHGDFHAFLEEEGLVARRLGSTDYSIDAPLKAIIRIMDECKGAIILGYPQIEIFQHVRRSATVSKEPALLFATPWNQIEGSLAYGAKLPVLVVTHPHVQGGIFDHGVTGQYVWTQDLAVRGWHEGSGFKQVFSQWKDLVQRPPRKTSKA